MLLLVYQLTTDFSQRDSAFDGNRNVKLMLIVLLVGALVASLSSAPAYAQQEEPVDAVQASGDATAADNTVPPDTDSAARHAALPERAGVMTGQSAAAVLQQWPRAGVWLNADSTDGTSRSVLALVFTPPTKLPATAVVVLADEAGNAGDAMVTALARGLASRGLAALTLGLPAPPGGLGRWMDRELPLPAAGSASDAGPDAAADFRLIDVMPDAGVSDAEAHYRQGVTADVQAAVRYLKREGYQKIVIAGIGRGAGFVTAVPELTEIAGLIWLLPRFYPSDRQQLKQHFGAASALRVLDVQPARGDGLRLAQERTVIMNQAGVADYQRQRVAVQAPVQARYGDTLASRMAAWILAGSDTATH